MKAAAVQFAASWDTEASTTAALTGVRMAAEQGASLIVLPEASLCGFGTRDSDLAALAQPLDGPFVNALSRAAAETGATVVAGTFEPAPDGRVYNTLAVVGPRGLLGAYRKVHLYDALGWRESDRVAPGDPDQANVVVVEVGEIALGMLTCYDLRFPESARLAVDGGATALAVPAAWVAGPEKAEHWRTLLRARAIENTAYVVAAAQPGPAFTGRSQIVDPMGVVVAELGEDEGADSPAVVVGELSAARVAEARARAPVLAHRRLAVAPRATAEAPATR